MVGIEEFDALYFDGGASCHAAGYTRYVDGSDFEVAADKLMEYIPAGAKVLEIGCAKGFLIKQLRERGADATGVDGSSYAVNSSAEMGEFITLADVRTFIGNCLDNEYDYIISKDTLCIFTDMELVDLIVEFNRVATKQIHLLFAAPNPEYYNAKSISEWGQFGWAVGTVLRKGGEEITK